MPRIESEVDETLWSSGAYGRLTDFGSMTLDSRNRYGADRFITPIEAGLDPVSFADVEQFVRGFELFLESHGVGPGDRCAVISNNSTTLVLLFIAIMATDRVFVPVNPNSSADDMTYIVGDCEATVVLFDGALEEKVGFLQENCEIVPFEDGGPFIRAMLELAKGRPNRAAAPTAASVAEIVYTTGTTGRPKGVKLTHRNLIADLFGIGQLFDFQRGTRFLTITPLFHNSGQIMTTLIPLYCGGVTTAVRPDMGFINFWHYVDRFEPEWTLVMPSHVALMLDRKETPESRSLKGILCGGAKLERKTQLDFEERFGTSIFPNYGLTESASIATCARLDDADRASGSVGRPLDINQVKVFKANREAAPLEVGEIRISGDNVFTAYLNLPDVYADKVKGGWLHTGDLGYADAAGYVFIVDRIDNMVIVGGENIYPSEVERFAPELAGVSEGFLLSLPDRIMGRELVLVYKLSHGASSNEKQWRSVLFTKLARFKVPRRFVDVRDLGVEDFPRSASGKLLRKRLQGLLEARLLPTPPPHTPVRDARASRLLKKVATTLATIVDLDADEVTEAMHMDHVASWDSMCHLRLMLAIEDAFGVTLSPGQMASMTSVKAIVDILEQSESARDT